MLMELKLNESEVQQIIWDHVSKSVPNVNVGEVQFHMEEVLTGHQLEQYYTPIFKGAVVKIEL